MLLVHKTLFDSELVNIRHAVARPSSITCSNVEHGLADQLVMPIAGVFAKHDSPKQHVIANSNHALFFGYGKPYRISFPGDIGDESLVIKFSKAALAHLLIEMAGIEDLYSPLLNTHCLLSPSAVLDRSLLRHYLAKSSIPSLAIEEVCVSILTASVRAACKNNRTTERTRRSFTMSRRRQQVEAVKEVISLYPMQEWTLETLAHQANTSPYHLARIFRHEVGIPVHQYLVRTRLAKAMESMHAAGTTLTDIAVESGFSTHSHFSSSFRSLFGITPSQLRMQMNG